MKKIIASVLFFLFGLSGAFAIEKPDIESGKEINVYLFRGEGCGHCHNAVEYFNDLKGEYDEYFSLKSFEIYNSSENRNLLTSVIDYLEIDPETVGVPFIVIGENYHSIGFNEAKGTEIIEKALEEFQNKDYVDIVEKVKKEKSSSAKDESLEQAVKSEGLNYKGISSTSNSSSDAYIILAIFAGISALIGSFIFIARKN